MDVWGGSGKGGLWRERRRTASRSVRPPCSNGRGAQPWERPARARYSWAGRQALLALKICCRRSRKREHESTGPRAARKSGVPTNVPLRSCGTPYLRAAGRAGGQRCSGEATAQPAALADTSSSWSSSTLPALGCQPAALTARSRAAAQRRWCRGWRSRRGACWSGIQRCCERRGGRAAGRTLVPGPGPAQEVAAGAHAAAALSRPRARPPAGHVHRPKVGDPIGLGLKKCTDPLQAAERRAGREARRPGD